MSKTIQGRIHDEQVLDQVRHLAASATLNPYDQLVLVTDTEAVVVTLPNVAESVGRLICVRTVDGSNNNGVDVVAAGDQRYSTTEVDPSAGTTVDVSSAVAQDTSGDFTLWYSDGIGWILMAHYIQ